RAHYTGELVKQWDRCNAIVVSWLIGIVNKILLAGILYRSSAALITTQMVVIDTHANPQGTNQCFSTISPTPNIPQENNILEI
ncbi:hypothetical protein HAX54_038752, partial [Datura stramonium]|nr:hypothetical protein [Datura stramonium]